MRPKLTATGTRGSWFADVAGARLACVHRHWLKGRRYSDPHAEPGRPPWDEFIRAIAAGGKVVLTNDDHLGGGSFRRTGYIAVWSVANVHVSNSTLTFEMVDRLADLD
jgi:hypothetical protein